MLTLPEAFPDRRHAERHNAAVAAACADAAVRRGLAAALTVSPTPRHQGLVAETALGLAAAAGGQGQQQQLRAAHLVAALRQVGQQRVQGVVRAVAQLSVLELILLVAAARLRDKLSRSNLSTCDAVNFEMVGRSGSGAEACSNSCRCSPWQQGPLPPPQRCSPCLDAAGEPSVS